MDVSEIQETHLFAKLIACVLSRDFVVYSVYGDRLARGVSLMNKRTLGSRVNLVYVHAEVVNRG